MAKGGYVYIMSNIYISTLYIGVTSELARRVYEHKAKHDPKSFTSKYNLNQLVYYEFYESIEVAIEREKQLKKSRREKKDQLIDTINPTRKDLWSEVQDFD